MTTAQATISRPQAASAMGVSIRTLAARYCKSHLPDPWSMAWKLLARTHAEQRATSPGKRVRLALKALLESHLAHVTNLEDPPSPPFTGDNDADLSNNRLGWTSQSEEWRRTGPAIGYLTFGRDTSEPVVLFDHQVAFQLAQRHFPNLLPPGMKPQ